jgi:hypothetical protein
MPVLSLPLTFGNSFWSQDYRKGLEVLYAKLEQVQSPGSSPIEYVPHLIFKGTEENDEIINFLRVRLSSSVGSLSPALTHPYRRERQQNGRWARRSLAQP